MTYASYKLNKQGDNIQPWCTPFPIWNQSVVPCPVLTVAFRPTSRFLKRWVRWSGIPISWRMFPFIVIHTVKGFGIVKKAEIDVFLELSCFFQDPVDVGNLISGSSAFSKTSLNIWKFTVHVLVKPGLETFEHYFTSVWDDHSNLITHLEPDILQCEVKQALGSITMSKASGGDGIPVELFQKTV